jgi:ArsR family transcriptional regulator, virulence genes transcriptional regulator
MTAKTMTSDFSKLEKQAQSVAATLGAMANANRLLILCHLAGGEKTVSEIIEICSITQSAVSQHLAKMRLMGLVTTRREGKQIHYRIASEAVTAIMQTLYAFYCAPQVRSKKQPRVTGKVS